MSYDQVKRVWDVAKTEALELQHPSKKNARVKDLRTIAQDLCEKMNVCLLLAQSRVLTDERFQWLLTKGKYRLPAEELDEYLSSDSKFRYEPTGGIHTPWSEAGDGHWFQKLRCHLDLVNFASLFGFILFYNPGVWRPTYDFLRSVSLCADIAESISLMKS